ncbi:Cytochrome b561 and DOMON domain-containing protein [Vitis vinifera]|uniref:non-specific serine/threonine protein kinase n=1 Tax=Vitis vinifera TaxID=29760 RepID=A0A438J6J2_VITVI|nr:Cytochrome b561 and DOMON domain-containing protein [Vitis vinifera]
MFIAFGVVTLEVIMGRHPGELITSLLSSASSSSSSPSIVDHCLLNDVMDQRPSPPVNQVAEEVVVAVKLALACLRVNPQSRPTMQQSCSSTLNTVATIFKTVPHYYVGVRRFFSLRTFQQISMVVQAIVYYREETHPVPVEMTRGNVQLFRSMICHHVMSLQPLEYIFSLKGSSIRAVVEECRNANDCVSTSEGFSGMNLFNQSNWSNQCLHSRRYTSGVNNTGDLKTLHADMGLIAWGALLPFGQSSQDTSSIMILNGRALYNGLESDGIPKFNIHRPLGSLVFCLSILQVLELILRPDKTSKWRKDWKHHWVGRLALFLGALKIVIGLLVQEAGSGWKIGYGFLITFILVTVTVLDVSLGLGRSNKADAIPVFGCN